MDQWADTVLSSPGPLRAACTSDMGSFLFITSFLFSEVEEGGVGVPSRVQVRSGQWPGEAAGAGVGGLFSLGCSGR